LGKIGLPDFGDDRCLLLLILRLSILFNRNRLDDDVPQLNLSRSKSEFRLEVASGWLTHNPLTESALQNELAYWQEVGIKLMLSQSDA